MVIVICNDSTTPGLRLVEFKSLDEAEDWIDTQIVPVEGVGTRSRKMYRIFVGEEIQPTKGTE